MQLSEVRAVVTGGVSGLGLAVAEHLVAHGARVALFDVNDDKGTTAVAALGDSAFVEHARAHNAQWRRWFADEIGKLGNAGLRAVPSQANFVLVLFEGSLTAEVAYKGLMDAGYIVRWLPNQGLAHGLRMQVIAEGVETLEQLDYLRGRGCDEVQGHIYSRPEPVQTVEVLLRRGWVEPSPEHA